MVQLVAIMASIVNKHCVCHVADIENEPICSFSEVSWAKFNECIKKWKTLDGVEQVLSQQFDHESACQEEIGFHRKCYQRFTDSRRLDQAERRKVRGGPRKANVSDDVDEQLSENDELSEPRSKRCLRSETGSSTISTVQRRSVHVLPPICIVCKGVKRSYDKLTKKRSVERLVSCETDGRTLLKAAELKNDESLLVHLRDQDLLSVYYTLINGKMRTTVPSCMNPHLRYSVQKL